MSEEPFSAEYFQHLLNSLTLNSRALIVELTGLAERYTDNASDIVKLIEERMVKILPKYKLYSFYLMDSIVKNIGNPYNLLFANNLYKIFTETYLVVTDTITRQNLINLFKTWISGQTTTGLNIFPQEVLGKIEQFIIKATTLNNNGHDEGIRLTRDTLLREGNYLLQYVIAMDEELEAFSKVHQFEEEQKTQIALFHKIRNNLIYGINTISEAAMTNAKPDFEKKKDQLASDLQHIRRTLDDQGFQQQALLREVMDAHKTALKQEQEELLITVKLEPKAFDFDTLFGQADNGFHEFIVSWGMPIADEEVKTPPLTSAPVIDAEQEKPEAADQSLAASLGFNLPSFNFQESFLGSPKNELTSVSSVTSGDDSDEDEGDGYDPEGAITEQEHAFIASGGHDDIQSTPATSPAPLTTPFNGKSSMKRAHSAGDAKVVKKVRFDV